MKTYLSVAIKTSIGHWTAKKMKTLSTQIIASSLVALALTGCATSAGQQKNSSTVPDAKQSITDGEIAADYKNYEGQQGRIKVLNDSGKFPVASYSMSKAQCWLDVSLHEYSRNDRSNFPRLAFEQSRAITDFLSKDGNAQSPANPAMKTPLVNDAATLRPDLWDALSKLKGHSGYRCAAQKAACAEVELVHAGNEFNQQQWRHAKPYVQIAEDLTADAQRAAEACVPPPVAAVPVAVVAAAPAPAVAPVVVPFNAAANVLFNFDKRDMPNVRAYTKDQLDSLIAQVKAGAINVVSIKLTGHADRLNSTGDANYNTKLSQDRVETIKSYMTSNGVSANLISAEYKADAQQIEACTKPKFASQAELQECLLPNRRVEVLVTGTRK
jgi:OmpA-OmpF porin, OOP family